MEVAYVYPYQIAPLQNLMALTLALILLAITRDIITMTKRELAGS